MFRTIYKVQMDGYWGQGMTNGEKEPESKKRPGRPATGKRGNFTFRVTDALRSQLEEASRDAHLSVSEVVETRLNRSFEYDYMMGDGELALVLRTIGTAVRRFEVKTGKSFAEDEATAELCYGVALRVLNALMAPTPAPAMEPNKLSPYLRQPTEAERLEVEIRERRYDLSLREAALQASIDVLGKVEASCLAKSEEATPKPGTTKYKGSSK